MKKNIFKNKKVGFTLIEMLVAVLVFSIIIVSISGIFIFSVKEQRKLLNNQILLDQVSYALEYMSRALRMGIKQSSELPSCLDYEGQNYKVYESGGTIRIRFINALQDNDCQEFYLENNQIMQAKGIINSATPTVINLTSSGYVKINSLKFNVSGESQEDYLQPRVTFSIEAEPVGGNLKTPLKIQTTITQRTLDIQL